MARSVLTAVTEGKEEARNQQVLLPLTFIFTKKTRTSPIEPSTDWESEAGCHSRWPRTCRMQARNTALRPLIPWASTGGGSPPTAVIIGFQDFLL